MQISCKSLNKRQSTGLKDAGLYLLSYVVDPGRRAVAEVRPLGVPDPVRSKTQES